MSKNLDDQFPNLRLLKIFPLSARAKSWRARISLNNIFSEQEVVQIDGSIHMLSSCKCLPHKSTIALYFHTSSSDILIQWSD